MTIWAIGHTGCSLPLSFWYQGINLQHMFLVANFVNNLLFFSLEINFHFTSFISKKETPLIFLSVIFPYFPPLPRNRSKIPTYGLRLRIGSSTAQNGHHRNMYEARVLRSKFCSLSTPTWRYGKVHCLGMLRIKAFSMTGKLSCHSQFIVFSKPGTDQETGLLT